MLNPLNNEKLRAEFAAAKPVPHIVIDNFLDRGAAKAIVDAYPDFDTALRQGRILDRERAQESAGFRFYRVHRAYS
jgi:hypothetical protein